MNSVFASTTPPTPVVPPPLSHPHCPAGRAQRPLTPSFCPQLLLEHQDAYQAGAVFPDAFYPSLCERGEWGRWALGGWEAPAVPRRGAECLGESAGCLGKGRRGGGCLPGRCWVSTVFCSGDCEHRLRENSQQNQVSVTACLKITFRNTHDLGQDRALLLQRQQTESEPRALNAPGSGVLCEG